MRLFSKTLIFAALGVGMAFQASAQRWQTQNTGVPYNSRAVNSFEIVDSNIVWLTTRDGSGDGRQVREFSKTTNGGISWQADSIKGPRVRFSYSAANISAIDADTAYSLLYNGLPNGTGGGVFKTTNGGLLWNQLDTTMFTRVGHFPNFVHMFSAARGLTMGDQVNSSTVATPFFEIYTTSNHGKTWQRVPSDSIPAPLPGTGANAEYGIVNVFTAVGDTFMFGTNKGRVFRSVNGGRRWTVSVAYGTSISVSALAFRNGREGLIIGFSGTGNALVDGGIRRTTNGGISWTSGAIGAATGGILIKSGICHVPGTNLYAISGASDRGNNGTAYTTDLGTTWTQMDYVTANTPTGLFRAQRTNIAFANARVGWAGHFTSGQPTNTGGVVRFIPSTIAPRLEVLTSFGTTQRCGGSVVNVPVRIIGRYHPNNSFQLQLSDSLGAFTQPTILTSITTATLSDTLNSVLSVTLPLSAWGPSFRFRLLSNAPAQSALLANTFAISRAPAATIQVGANDTLFVDFTQGATYQWRLNGANIGGAINRKIKAVAPGIYTVRVTLQPCVGIFSDGVQFPVTNTKQANLLTGVGIYPNPAHNNLSFYTALAGTSELRISTISGQQLIREQFVANADAHKIIDISALPVGLYFLRATQNGKSATIKFVKQ